MNNKGQSVISEYVMIFFVVIAVVVAMKTFVQRGFQARIHDARNYMINAVAQNCSSNCVTATGGITYEYEPYYAQISSQTQRNAQNTTGVTGSSSGDIDSKVISENSQTGSYSCQLPPECAGLTGQLPLECICQQPPDEPGIVVQ